MSLLSPALRNRVLSCFGALLLIGPLLLGSSVTHAYERTFPAIWSPPNAPGSTTFLPATCGGVSGDGITPNPNNFGFWFVSGKSGRPSEPAAIQARVIAFANASCPLPAACSTPVVYSAGSCTIKPEWFEPSALCYTHSTRTVSPDVSYKDGQPVCGGTPIEITKDFAQQYLKSCAKVSNAHYEAESGECTCNEGLYVPEKNSCLPITDRYFQTHCDTCHGNPIVALTGAKLQPIELGRLSWLPLKVTFNSSRRVPYAGGVQPFMRSDVSLLGDDWKPSFERRLYTDVHKDMSQPAKLINVQRADGNWTSFQSTGSTFAPASPALNDRLTVVTGGYLYFDAEAGTIERYDAIGRLTRLSTLNGSTIDVTRSGGAQVAAGDPDADGLPLTLTDQTGRTHQLKYIKLADGGFRLSRIQGPGTDVQFSYDAQARLSGATFADGVSKTFLYEDAAHAWALTGYLDENQVRAGTYGYDAEGRAVSTARAQGLDAYAVTWGTPPKWNVATYYDNVNQKLWRDHYIELPHDVRVTYPNGDVESLEAGGAYGSVKWSAKTRGGSAGGTPSTERRVLDQNQNVVQYDDPNGNRSCASFDLSRNLETVRVEGLGASSVCATVLAGTVPAGARKVSSQWHPDWRLATRTAEPRRLTTLVFNGQPDPFNGNAVATCAPVDAKLPDNKPIVVLCKRVEQATTDETGALGFSATLQSGVSARTASWTYNASGQVLTETDALNRVVVTNEYYADTTVDHTKGDLKSSTNAMGHVTRFPRYDAAGNPLEVVDANTSSTTYTYDLRQRVTTVTSAGGTTSYEYWPTGLLKKSSQQDGSAVSYEYDDAHRLVAASDTRGNRVEYTLDASGNKTGEVAKDPSGALKRTMSRAFDALGRAQQTTGRE
ncbi:RHS repeat domain-containing protein [Mitsuaria sp. 7]|uniref:RHS repeat domain-containing protein n=1 Tax=Mitsuaria sp. 7 TaxID=1658665 RepID=UPI00082F5813|nr:RHS repeat protein [Mitsuaria sp. 7]